MLVLALLHDREFIGNRTVAFAHKHAAHLRDMVLHVGAQLFDLIKGPLCSAVVQSLSHGRKDLSRINICTHKIEAWESRWCHSRSSFCEDERLVLNCNNVDLILLISSRFVILNPKALLQKQDISVQSSRGIIGRLICLQYVAEMLIPLLRGISIPFAI